MTSDAKFEVVIEREKNVLRMYLRGAITPADMHACVDAAERSLPALPHGFKVLTDLSALESMDVACIPEVERLMDLCRGAGVDTVARVIPNPSKDIGFNILSLFHYPSTVRLITCPTLEDARRALG